MALNADQRDAARIPGNIHAVQNPAVLPRNRAENVTVAKLRRLSSQNKPPARHTTAARIAKTAVRANLARIAAVGQPYHIGGNLKLGSSPRHSKNPPHHSVPCPRAEVAPLHRLGVLVTAPDSANQIRRVAHK